MVQLLWKMVWQFPPKLHVIQQLCFCVCIDPKELKAGHFSDYPHTLVHSSTVRNTQEVEATQVSADGRMDQHKVVRPDNELLFRLKKGNSPICYNMDEP